MVGFSLSVGGLATLIALWSGATGTDLTSGAMGLMEFMFLFPVPLSIAVIVTVLLKGYFVPDRKRHKTSDANITFLATAQVQSAPSANGRFNEPLTWFVFVAGASVLLSLAFPTWELPGDHSSRLGRGTMLGPTDSAIEAVQYQCSHVLYDAKQNYTRLSSSVAADEQRWQDGERAWNEHEEAVRRIRD